LDFFESTWLRAEEFFRRFRAKPSSSTQHRSSSVPYTNLPFAFRT
jgi:hypothetical protein